MFSHFFIVLSSVFALVACKYRRGDLVHSQLVNPHTSWKRSRIITNVTEAPQSSVFRIYVLSYVHPLCSCEITAFFGAFESDTFVRGIHVEIQSLPGGQLVAALLARVVHLQLSFPSFLLVTFSR